MYERQHLLWPIRSAENVVGIPLKPSRLSSLVKSVPSAGEQRAELDRRSERRREGRKT